MKPETLEALLIDRSLGELEPATAELLDAYLARNPDAAARAAAWQDTTHLARTAVGVKTSAASAVTRLPAMPPWRRESTRLSRVVSAQWLKLAACLALGGAVGWLARPVPNVPQVVATPPPTVVVVQQPEVAPMAESQPSLAWSTRMLARAEAASAASVDRSPARYRLHWESPARKPILEEKQ